MIKSMTAYGEKSLQAGELLVSVEIKTYNSRYLDTTVRLPGRYRQLEKDIKQLVTDHVGRGRVELTVTIQNNGGGEADHWFEVDQARAESYYRVLLQLKETFQLSGEIPIELLARGEGVIRAVEPAVSVDDDWPYISEAVREALAKVNEMRQQEGAQLAEDFEKRLFSIEKLVKDIKKQAREVYEAYYHRLKERIEILTDGLAVLDEGRIAQEAALYADKADITEEIVRAESHVEQFRKAMASEDACGRKLSFLLQEFNREFNTMGAKIGDPDISEKVVAAKTELEKLREQIQNIE